MPIPFTCPYCGATWEVSEEYAGQSGTCSTCAQPITIPASTISTREISPRKSMNTSVLAALIVIIGMLGLGVLGAVGWLLMPTLAISQSTTLRHACGNNLKQIALAMNSYHEAYGSYPPAYLADDKGTPMHSWRVLILPYLGKQELYNAYNFDEPWDGPNNSLLTGEMPELYFCPENPDKAAKKAGETNYMVVRGPQTMFPNEKSVKATDILDGTSTTIMLVETTTAGVNWLSPTDLSTDTAKLQINASPTEPGSFHAEGGINVATADGTVYFLPERTRSKAFRNSLTRSGGEQAHLNAVPGGQ